MDFISGLSEKNQGLFIFKGPWKMFSWSPELYSKSLLSLKNE